MGFLDKLFGRDDTAQPPHQQTYGQGPVRGSRWDTSNRTNPNISYTDEQALARYRYMLKTAPPEALEEAHAEAFAKLTPEQRQILLQQLSQDAPAGEVPQDDDPRTLARAATRAEMRRPGSLERTMGGGMMGGMGGAMAGSMLGSVAGMLIGSAIAHSFFASPAVAADYNSSSEAQGAGDVADPAAEAEYGAFDSAGNADPYGDPAADGAYDSQGNADPYGDPGADSSYDSGGDFGGGDFGGGDFGGDFGGGDF